MFWWVGRYFGSEDDDTKMWEEGRKPTGLRV
jgi:hypothetical protein